MAKTGLFSGLKTADVSAGGIYFLANKGKTYSAGKKADEYEPAFYKVRVKKCTAITSRKKHDLFIVEALVEESDCPERKKGVSCSWVVNMAQDAALGNILGFLAACAGVDVTDDAKMAELKGEAEEMADLAVSDDNPLKDTLLSLECVMIETKAGNPFTLHKWSAIVA